ncbi:MAG: Flp family type IVb pilin [Nocardioides sp.]|nr:Flp family type IVb pilin [Nocardioides sp.]
MRTLVRSQSSGFSRNRRTERGASAVEYGLLIAGIAALIAVIVFAFGDSIGDVLFEDTCQQLVAGSGQGDCV